MAWLRSLAEIIFPPVCRVCQRRGEFPICADCLGAFRLIAPPVCQRCGRPLSEAVPSTTCQLCRSRRVDFLKARAGGIYEGALREAIHALKFGQCRAMARPLGRLMAAAVCDEFCHVDLVVPVPLHATRHRERGFNQCDLLAREVAREATLPLEGTLLLRTRATEAQSGLDRNRRRVNVVGAFSTREALTGERILLVDDVMSTGCTVSECARALRQGGAGEVFVVTAAMALSER